MSDTPETDEYAKADWWTLFRATEHSRILERERNEARESLKHITEYGTEEINAAVELRQKLASALVERDETQKEFSSIHRWIERNHADGFIDSLTYLQNLERVTDSWYDRIDAIETDARRFVKERDEARDKYDKLATEHMLVVNKLCKERDDAQSEIQRLRFDAQREAEHHDRMVGELEKVYTERDDALEKVKELIYISDRAIALAEINFENDKFGVVSELRSDLEKIKKSK